MRFARFYSRTFHNSIFLYLISCTKLLFDFFYLASEFSVGNAGLPVSIPSSQQNIIKTKFISLFILNASNIPYLLWAYLYCLRINSFAYVFVAYVSTHLRFCTYSLISNRRKNHNSNTKHITAQDQTYCFNYFIAQKL